MYYIGSIVKGNRISNIKYCDAAVDLMNFRKGYKMKRECLNTLFHNPNSENNKQYKIGVVGMMNSVSEKVMK